MQVPATTGATLIRMSAQRAAGGYDRRLVRGEDMDMFLRLAQVGPIEALPLTTFIARRHAGLRGRPGAQWSVRDVEENARRVRAYVGPVFRERWTAARDRAGRDEGHAWALGLAQRGLTAEARDEAARWPAPHAPAEAWIRDQVGLTSRPADPGPRVVVVDDGDPGALEQTLSAIDGADLWVDLEVPRDPLGAIQLHWPGTFAARATLRTWLPPGPFSLRLSSAPDWASPTVPARAWLPDLPAPDAVLALAAAAGWSPPARTRPGLRGRHAVTAATQAARAAMTTGRAAEALALLEPLMARLPGWVGVWWMAGEALEMVGAAAEAGACRRRADALMEQAAG
jgi:hypothetical protein